VNRHFTFGVFLELNNQRLHVPSLYFGRHRFQWPYRPI
jgi:hypothetical protein